MRAMIAWGFDLGNVFKTERLQPVRLVQTRRRLALQIDSRPQGELPQVVTRDFGPLVAEAD